MAEHGSIWITANAGSGKTTFLTRRVVALLLAGVLPERICCITYTKAAASEMRERVLSTLRRLLLADDATCRAEVAELLGRAATDADVARARSLFGAVLDSVSGGLQLTTIHGFCQNILKRFPLEAGIAPHFTVLEDEASRTLLTRAKHRLLSEYRAGDAALDAAFEVIGSRSSESRFDDYVSSIISKRGMWEAIWRHQTPETLRPRLFALHGLVEDTNDEVLRAALCACVSEAQAAVIRAHLPLLENHKNKAEQGLARIMCGWLELDTPLREALIDDFCLLFLTKEGSLRKQFVNKKEFPEGSPLAEVLSALAVVVERFYTQSASLANVEESYAIAIIARALLTQYEQAKAAVYALDYDDLIGKTRELFANPAMLGWVMSKLDHRIDHLLIDEAQDTSGEQWSIAHLLVEELIAANEGVGSGNLPRSLLVVGDEKQSIYSFQGAAPELFSNKKTQFHDMLFGSSAPLSEEMLTNSYRSAEAVLTLVDHIAARPEIASSLNEAGVIHPHQLKRTSAAGCVTLYPALIAPEKEVAPALTLPMEYALSKSATQQLADAVAENVAQWLASGRMLASEGRPVAAGDILILVRRRATLVLALIRAFERRNVPVAGLDRLTLSEHLAVRDLLALMRFVLNPADDLALAQVLRSPIIGMSDEDLRALCVARAGSLWAALKDHPAAIELARALANRDASPYEFLTDILEVQGARTRFAKRFGEEVHEVLDELKNQAAAMPKETTPTLAYFHDWMHGSTRQIKREQEGAGSGKVRIMTVHGAKGLEAPVVILADMVGLPTTQFERIYFAEDAHGQPFPVLAISEEAQKAPLMEQVKERKKDALMAEYYRLFYVALTRARDELHLWGTATKKGNINDATWYALAESSLKQLGAVEENGALVLRDARPAVAAKADAQTTLEKHALPAWATASAPRLRASVAAVTPSQLAPEVEVSAYAQAGGGSSRARGVTIHRILELLTAESAGVEIATLTAILAPDWTAAEQAKAVAEVERLMRSERWIWQNPSHAEVTISGTIDIAGTSMIVSGQIDRLVETVESVVILDYKTGAHVPPTQAEISENYRVQMKTYHALVRQICPQKPVRCAILWTASPLLMWCDDVIATTEWPTPFAVEQKPLVA